MDITKLKSKPECIRVIHLYINVHARTENAVDARDKLDDGRHLQGMMVRDVNDGHDAFMPRF